MLWTKVNHRAKPSSPNPCRPSLQPRHRQELQAFPSLWGGEKGSQHFQSSQPSHPWRRNRAGNMENPGGTIPWRKNYLWLMSRTTILSLTNPVITWLLVCLSEVIAHFSSLEQRQIIINGIVIKQILVYKTCFSYIFTYSMYNLFLTELDQHHWCNWELCGTGNAQSRPSSWPTWVGVIGNGFICRNKAIYCILLMGYKNHYLN